MSKDQKIVLSIISAIVILLLAIFFGTKSHQH